MDSVIVCALTESVRDRAMLCIAQSLVRVIVKSGFELLFFWEQKQDQYWEGHKFLEVTSLIFGYNLPIPETSVHMYEKLQFPAAVSRSALLSILTWLHTNGVCTYAKIIIPTLEQKVQTGKQKAHTWKPSASLSCPGASLVCSNTALLKLYFLGTLKFH